jgi:predicted porin
LLPAGLLFKATTTQNGFDLSAVFGMYPGLNDAKGGALGANSGGSPLGLGTPGIDFRQAYVTFGNTQWGTVKVGRDIGIFGSDAILNDATLLSVGATGSNQNPANTALGRIGLGYIYADWIPQISYASPILAGFQETVGVFTPLDEFNNSGLSASSTAHDTPMFQGKITWDYKAEPLYYKAEPSYKAEPFAVRIWTSGLFQPQQGIVLTTPTGPVQTQRSATAAAIDVGTKVDFDPFSLVAYYYWGRGVGTTALFFDGLSPTGETRDSEGYYIQGSWKPIPKLKLVASYGQSSLDLAPGDTNAELLVRRNAAWIGGAYYSLTDWLTLVGEYAYVTSQAQGGNQAIEHSFDVGTFLAF